MRKVFQKFLNFLDVCLTKPQNKEKLKLKEKGLEHVCKTRP
jgi:hypothetical protein